MSNDRHRINGGRNQVEVWPRAAARESPLNPGRILYLKIGRKLSRLFGPPQGIRVKKTYFGIIAGGLAIATVVMGGSRIRAQVGSTGSSRIPLSSLAGSFAGKGNSKVTICFNENFTAVQSCSRTPDAQIVSFVENSKSHATVDIRGGTCAEVREISAPEPPSRLSTAVNNYIAVGVTTSYNPDTGSGDVSFEFYLAKPGVTCNGATFVNTAKAPVKFAETAHFLVSENGTRFDLVVQTIHTTPVDFVSGLVAHGFALRQ